MFRVCRVFSCVRHGSSSAEKWTSVSPCLEVGNALVLSMLIVPMSHRFGTWWRWWRLRRQRRVGRDRAVTQSQLNQAYQVGRCRLTPSNPP